jgi:predicted nucleic acid-binding protein
VKQVLDSRFLIEYFYSEDENIRRKAVRKVEDLIRTGEGLIPTIVVCETIQLVSTREGKEKAELVYLSLLASGIRFESLTSSIAKEAGFLKSTHKNVPIGDCIIAATAMMNRAKIVSDDPHFNEMKDIKTIWIA